MASNLNYIERLANRHLYPRIFVFLTLFRCFSLTGSINLYEFVQSNNGTVFTLGKRCYVVHQNLRHEFPNRYTMQTYGYFWTNLSPMNDSVRQSTRNGELIDNLWDHHPNVQLLNKIPKTGSLIEEPSHILPFLNPSMIYRNKAKDWIISWRTDPHSFRIVVLPEMNTTSLSKNLTASTHWLTERAAEMASDNPPFPHVDLKGEDPRLFEMSSGSVYVVFAKRFPRRIPEIRMAYAELFLTSSSAGNVTTGNMNMSLSETEFSQRVVKVHTEDIVDVTMERREDQHHDQKNWSPFEHEGRLHFVSTIKPHTIVRVAVTDPHHSWIGVGKVVATTDIDPTSDFHWEYGQLRGGSQVLRLNNDRFLTLFHSSVDPPDTGNVLKTYVMGAYLFSAEKDKQFEIKAISTEPIVHESFYNGTWTYLPESYYHIDYVVFPMSIFVEGDDLIVLYGKQDKEGWIAKINISKLLASLKRLDDN